MKLARTAVLLIIGILMGAATVHAVSPEDRLWRASGYANSGQRDFAFLEYYSFVREFPNHPERARAEFYVGEYYFDQNSPDAASHLERAKNLSSDEIVGLICDVYLLKFGGNGSTTEEIDASLRDWLSSQRFFAVFKNNRSREWVSPSGRRFRFRESVDQLEIFRDGEPLYTISLR